MPPASAICAENLVLRKQLAAYIERGIKPKRLDHAGRVSLSMLSRIFSWREAIVTVRHQRSSVGTDSAGESFGAGRGGSAADCVGPRFLS